MTKRTWLILGASSVIAEEFANLAALAKNDLILVGRNLKQLEIIAANIRLRHGIDSTVLCIDFASDIRNLLDLLGQQSQEFDLFIAHSVMTQNAHLSAHAIDELLHTNVVSTVQIIHSYLQRIQKSFHIVFLSSVAACRGRNKNSLYGGSKAAVEVYLQGLQQTTNKNLHITIAKLGFIDTGQTYGMPGIFYASPPKACAKACWKAMQKGKPQIFHPFFWWPLMKIIKALPFFIYRRLKF
ncbi:SDR family NAD(P)-dependent oxidoreductase [Legionella jordanis]|uniref:Oxidoreductase n=1 Tax=Legionella jordanis TaxID=456 RepID=A0A0W0V8Q0_9GAMM|nr:SDR family NAD(P)-dependent oxidoreductase [Legionella jordanis]KTD16510.1 hypothetical protein Ljor_0816 [Legionella jordanis]RMX03944.1 SDR family NAD(P)-dependent oxidoreductase [Legionella jordanis]RMX21987.1 SDR family NAD(P)-dependent oxidoreductase [Legionella jordanis]VEH12029.1 oxidoreductase [Legionella jordanis]HAT8712669.1 SDR family NAD(P)-dependent oxidoreductase [Legionella jordanis]